MRRPIELRRLWLRRRPERAETARRVPAPATAAAAPPACLHCLHFRNDPADMEAAIPGLASLSSGSASVRGDDGLCLEHDRFVTARSSCPAFRGQPDEPL